MDFVLKWGKYGRKRPYNNADDLIRNNPAGQQIINSNKCNSTHNDTCYEAYLPDLTYKKLTIKAKLTRQHKQDKVAVSNLQLAAST